MTLILSHVSKTDKHRSGTNTARCYVYNNFTWTQLRTRAASLHDTNHGMCNSRSLRCVSLSFMVWQGSFRAGRGRTGQDSEPSMLEPGGIAHLKDFTLSHRRLDAIGGQEGRHQAPQIFQEAIDDVMRMDLNALPMCQCLPTTPAETSASIDNIQNDMLESDGRAHLRTISSSYQHIGAEAGEEARLYKRTNLAGVPFRREGAADHFIGNNFT